MVVPVVPTAKGTYSGLGFRLLANLCFGVDYPIDP